MKVLFIPAPGMLQPWYDDFLAAAGGAYPVDLYKPHKPLAEMFDGVEAVVELSGQIGNRQMVDAAVDAGVKLWQIVGTGLDHVDVAYFLHRGLPLANTPGQFSGIALAEHALFLMFCFAKHLNQATANVRSGTLYEPVNHELMGSTLGLIGLGASGRELARRAWVLGMQTLAVDVVDVPRNLREELHVEVFQGREGLHRTLGEADYVSIHAPLNASTRHLIDACALAMMKPTSVLINCARGQIVDENALVEVLRAGRIRGAGLDVFAQEPLSPQHSLLGLDNVIATPHHAGVTTGTSQRRAQAATENVSRVSRGLMPLYRVTSAD